MIAAPQTLARPESAEPNPLRTPCVLVIEDEARLAALIEYILQNAGYRVLKAERLDVALEFIHGGELIDAALVDISVNGREAFPVALALRERGVPFVFASGYGREGLPAEFSDCQLVQKPYLPECITGAIAALLR